MPEKPEDFNDVKWLDPEGKQTPERDTNDSVKEALSSIEKRAMQGETAPMGDELKDDASLLFVGQYDVVDGKKVPKRGEEHPARSPQEAAQLQAVAQMPQWGGAGGDPLSSGGQEVISLLRQMKDLLSEIKDKIPGEGTYGE